ncbi:MurR/RpiR family transcriptional regulator [Streptococcus suis]|nr:MurR/RpiR family transcriptional regulator [Streptococcus suis]
MGQQKLTETEEFVWQYITHNFSEVSKLTISELSEMASVSNATITRTLQKKGYSGFSEFKHDVQFNKQTNLSVLEDDQLTKDTKRSILKSYQEVTRTLNMLDVATIGKAVECLTQAKRIIIFARGFSELLANEIMIKLQLLDKRCELYTDPNIIRLISQRLSNEDTVLFISLNGETLELIEAAQSCRTRSVPTILISANQTGTLSYYTEHKLFGFKSELSYFPDFEVHSRLPLSVIAWLLLDIYAASQVTK